MTRKTGASKKFFPRKRDINLHSGSQEGAKCVLILNLTLFRESFQLHAIFLHGETTRPNNKATIYPCGNGAHFSARHFRREDKG